MERRPLAELHNGSANNVIAPMCGKVGEGRQVTHREFLLVLPEVDG
jgi:hypothetical protein